LSSFVAAWRQDRGILIPLELRIPTMTIRRALIRPSGLVLLALVANVPACEYGPGKQQDAVQTTRATLPPLDPKPKPAPALVETRAALQTTPTPQGA
jgi:hypothetical protein